jgi:hypothetical protein
MRRLQIGLLLVFSLLVAACGARAVDDMSDYQAAGEPAMEAAEKEVSGEVQSGGTAMASIPEQRMVIYNGALDLVVKDTVATQEEIGALADELEGFVLSSESYRYDEGLLRVELTLLIPAASFNTAMARLRDLALEVTHERVSSEDVTQEYVDLESRLRALEAKAERLEEFLDEAEDTEAVLKIYQELSATQEEIEHVKGRMRYLERSAAMATIDISLTPDEMAQPIEVAGWHPQGTAKRALQMLINAYQFLVDALIWIVILVIPVLLGIGFLVFLFVKLIQALFSRRKKKQAAALPEQESGEPPQPETKSEA